ncbi:MAG: hypothetical protein ACRYFA_11020 [Janthinobacterium lividum]
MDQKIQTGQSPEFLQQLLANPAAANQTHQQQLEVLVQTYPQCSIFHLLLAKALQNSEATVAAKALQTAAVHAANREVLFRLIYEPEAITVPKQEAVYPKNQISAPAEIVNPDASFMPEFSVKEDKEVVFTEDIPSAKIIDASFTDKNLVKKEAVFAKEIPSAEIIDASFIDENMVKKEAVFVKETPSAEVIDASFTDKNLALDQSSAANTSFSNPSLEEAIIAENDLRVEDVNLTFTNESAEEIVFPMEETIAQHQEETAVEEAKHVFAQEIDEEVYEEITAIEDIKFESAKIAFPQEKITVTEPELEITIEKPPVLTIQDKAEKDMLSSIAAIDYFSFDNHFGQKQVPEVREIVNLNKENETTNLALTKAETDEPVAKKEPETVSNYHDDKMPYTFMWWLDKTRKEYAGTYQPYVKVPQTQQPEQKLSVGPELHQQYIESIFHTKPPHNLTEASLPSVILPPVQRKEDQLIERFIIEEPHIHPPSMDRLDTENKAKKSSEDGDVLVTETLAKIYFDQMLYHKALDTYQKLILKFPEKSRYFTTQIELIEKKIN